MGSRDISNIPPRHSHFIIDSTMKNIADVIGGYTDIPTWLRFFDLTGFIQITILYYYYTGCIVIGYKVSL
jgi:hypothetical protein